MDVNLPTEEVKKVDIDSRPYENIGVNDSDINKIVISYLVHNCFKDTLDSFVACTGEKPPPINPDDMDKRKRIYNFVLDGDASKAIELTDEFAPGLLEEHKDLNFDLLTLRCLEFMRARKLTEGVEFARSNLSYFSKDLKHIDQLEDCMTLLAYSKPEESPKVYLLSPEFRQGVADRLNREILAHAKLPRYSAMERLIQQTTVVKQYLSEEFGKDGHHQPFSLEDFMKN